MTYTERARALRPYIVKASASLTDADALKAHTTQEGWEPDKVPALFTVIDETHAGTQDDPIPAAKGMEYTYGLYYTDPEDGKLYRCERTGEQPGGKVTLQFLPHELVGLYFTEG